MLEKQEHERFVFSDGGFQDFPNTTSIPNAVVTSKDTDLTTVKYENGALVPLTADDIAARQAEEFTATLQQYERDIDSMLDVKANEYGYDSIKTAVTYADEPAVPKFQDEGKAFRSWRSLVYAKGYEIADEVKTTGVIPTFDEVLAQLPAFPLDPIVTP